MAVELSLLCRLSKVSQSVKPHQCFMTVDRQYSSDSYEADNSTVAPHRHMPRQVRMVVI